MTELLFRDDGYLQSGNARVTAADERGIRLDRTVFYPTGGGQPGDTGVLRLASGQSIAIVDTLKGHLPDEIVHVCPPLMVLCTPSGVDARITFALFGSMAMPVAIACGQPWSMRVHDEPLLVL